MRLGAMILVVASGSMGAAREATGSRIMAGRDVRDVRERSGVRYDPRRCKVCCRGSSSLCTDE